MKKWFSLVAFAMPSVAFAGAFSHTDVTAAPVDVDVIFEWPGLIECPGGAGTCPNNEATFTFNSSTLVSSGNPLCNLSTATEDYCFEGWFSTDNKGWGLFVSSIEIVEDDSGCSQPTAEENHVVGLNIFKRRQLICELEQVIRASFGDTNVVYEFRAPIADVDYRQVRVFNGSNYFKAGSARSFGLTLDGAVAGGASFHNDVAKGKVIGYQTDGTRLDGTFWEN